MLSINVDIVWEIWENHLSVHLGATTEEIFATVEAAPYTLLEEDTQ